MVLSSSCLLRVQVVPEELASVMTQVAQNIEAQLRNPLYHYHHKVRLINYGGCYYFEPMTLETLAKVDPEAACAHHSATFSNPAEFTVVLTGNINRARILPLILTYLAGIPPLENAGGSAGPRDPRTLTPLPFTFPEQPVIEDVQVEMVSPITQSQITFPVELDRQTAREDMIWLAVACKVLEGKLLQRLRFEFGDVYTVSVGSFFGMEAPSRKGTLRGDVSVAFTCDPANKERVVDLALHTLDELQAVGPSEEEVERVKRTEVIAWQNSQAENSFWHETIVTGYQSRTYAECGDVNEVYRKMIGARDKVFELADAFRVQQSLQQLLPYPCRCRYTAITMMPKLPGLLGRLAFKLSSSPSSRYWTAVGAGTLAVGLAAAFIGWRAYKPSK
eukprot:jgi/Chrzof1/5528/Cz16g06130.t1